MWESLRALTGLRVNTASVATDKALGVDVLGQSAFSKILAIERKRSERSGRRFVLMLLNSPSSRWSEAPQNLIDGIIDVFSRSIRQTDILGWYEDDSTLAVIFTEIGDSPEKSVTNTLLGKMKHALAETQDMDLYANVRLSFHIYPNIIDGQSPPPPATSVLISDSAEPVLGDAVATD